jgi:hypothetical protein
MIIISVLWEDQRSVVTKGFGPHELLVSCVADELLASGIPERFQSARVLVEEYVYSRPMKGANKVLGELQQKFDKLSRSGPVCAVIDRDKVHKLLSGTKRPPTCFSGIRQEIAKRTRTSGEYELVLLVENVETLLAECCHATGSVMPRSKPSPDERDQILEKLAWGDAKTRSSLRKAVPSFDRLVRWVVDRLSPIITRRVGTRPSE